MKRAELAAFIQAIREVRGSLTDEQIVSVPAFYPTWRADRAYAAGDIVRYGEHAYRCLQTHQAQEGWAPGLAPSLWAKVLIPDPDVIPDWEQPDSTNAYKTGDKVRYKGKIYESLIDGNIWAPDAYPAGWKEIQA